MWGRGGSQVKDTTKTIVWWLLWSQSQSVNFERGKRKCSDTVWFNYAKRGHEALVVQNAKSRKRTSRAAWLHDEQDSCKYTQRTKCRTLRLHLTVTCKLVVQKAIFATAMWHPRCNNTPTHTVLYTERETASVVSLVVQRTGQKEECRQRQCMIGCKSHVNTRTPTVPYSHNASIVSPATLIRICLHLLLQHPNRGWWQESPWRRVCVFPLLVVI